MLNMGAGVSSVFLLTDRMFWVSMRGFHAFAQSWSVVWRDVFGKRRR